MFLLEFEKKGRGFFQVDGLDLVSMPGAINGTLNQMPDGDDDVWYYYYQCPT